MFCSNCGTQNSDDAAQCANCGQALQPGTAQTPPQVPPQQAVPRPDIPSYLVQAILITLCCCLPFGIVSIVYAAQVGGKITAGDYRGAMESSQKAKMWAWLGFGFGLAIQLVSLAMTLLTGAFSQSPAY